MTPEQKFLRVLAECSIKRDIQDLAKELLDRLNSTAKEYLASLEQDQFRDDTEKVEHVTDGGKMVEPTPLWTPEVGKLYLKTDDSGIIVECKSISINKIEAISPFYENPNQVLDIETFYEKYTPIAELEGLKVGDCVYSELGEAWSIDNIDGEVIVIISQGLIELDIKGVPYTFTNQQLFWRTADRAERFGKS